MLEVRDRVAERLCPQQDRERVRLALLIDVHESLGEVTLRDAQHPADEREPVADRRPLGGDCIDLRAQRLDPRLLLTETTLERVELDERRVRALPQGRVLLAELAKLGRVGAYRNR